MTTLQERFDAKWTPEPNTGCHLWTAGVTHGYGRFSIDGNEIRATHAAWLLAGRGDVPVNSMLCHRCDQPSCVNVEHLFLGTAKDNMTDKVAKGRARGARLGERHHMAKLSENQARAAFVHRASGMTQREIAKTLGVTPSNICMLLAGKTWPHLRSVMP